MAVSFPYSFCVIVSGIACRSIWPVAPQVVAGSSGARMLMWGPLRDPPRIVPGFFGGGASG